MGTLAAAPAKLSDPEVDAYNMRVGTQTFSGLYRFTAENLLVETARAITNLGSDTIKLTLGANFTRSYRTNLPANVTNLLTLARDEPNCHYVLDMPFRRIIAWAYPFANSDTPFQDGNYTPIEQTNDYREMYDLTRYLLTHYDNSGKTFYLGHWEGDGYLMVKNWTTNPSPAVVTNMIRWEINRQQAVDDAKAGAAGSNVNVFYYLEVNRVRDAMLNGPANNVRVANAVLPYVTNLDFVSYSSYDAQNLSVSDLYATLRYIETHTPPLLPAKAGTLPHARLWIGEYGWGGTQTPAQQEPSTRLYIQSLLNYRNALPFILFWEIYNNETNPDGSLKNYCLIDAANHPTPCFDLHQRFINHARLAAARFKELNGRLPTDGEFASLVSPILNQPLPAPTSLSLVNRGATMAGSSSATLSGSLTQGIYGEEGAAVRVYYGRQDGGTVRGAWEQSILLGVNSYFNPVTFNAAITNLAPGTHYFFRFYATNSSGEAWAPATMPFTTVATQQPPVLSLVREESGYLLTWPSFGADFALYLATNLAPPVVWSLATNQPASDNAQWQIALPPGADAARFYRLQSPLPGS